MEDFDPGVFPDDDRVYDASSGEYFAEGTPTYETNAAGDPSLGWVAPADYDDPYLYNANETGDEPEGP